MMMTTTAMSFRENNQIQKKTRIQSTVTKAGVSHFNLESRVEIPPGQTSCGWLMWDCEWPHLRPSVTSIDEDRDDAIVVGTFSMSVTWVPDHLMVCWLGWRCDRDPCLLFSAADVRICETCLLFLMKQLSVTGSSEELPPRFSSSSCWKLLMESEGLKGAWRMRWRWERDGWSEGMNGCCWWSGWWSTLLLQKESRWKNFCQSDSLDGKNFWWSFWIAEDVLQSCKADSARRHSEQKVLQILDWDWLSWKFPLGRLLLFWEGGGGATDWSRGEMDADEIFKEVKRHEWVEMIH